MNPITYYSHSFYNSEELLDPFLPEKALGPITTLFSNSDTILSPSPTNCSPDIADFANGIFAESAALISKNPPLPLTPINYNVPFPSFEQLHPPVDPPIISLDTLPKTRLATSKNRKRKGRPLTRTTNRCVECLETKTITQWQNLKNPPGKRCHSCYVKTTRCYKKMRAVPLTTRKCTKCSKIRTIKIWHPGDICHSCYVKTTNAYKKMRTSSASNRA